MANPRVWKNVKTTMQSALGAAITITAITKANPGVATAAGHGLADGNIVFLETVGMRQLDVMAVRVANKTADTFELEGINTSLYDTFVSGSARLITFGTDVVTIKELSAAGGDFEFIDYTTIHDDRKKEFPGLPTATKYTMSNVWDPTDPGLVAMKVASDAQERRAMCFQFGTGGLRMYFVGYVGSNNVPGGSAQQLVTSPSVITIHGNPAYYAS